MSRDRTPPDTRPASRRERAHAARKRRSRRPLVAVVVFLVVVTLGLLGGQWLLEQPFFRVHHVHVVGANHESLAQIEAAGQLTTHPLLVSLSTTAVANGIRQLPWISSVSVVKRWPNSVDITVHETHVVAVAAVAKGWVYVGANGHNVGPAPATANEPTIRSNEGATHWPFPADQNAVTVAAQLPPAFAAQVSTILVNKIGSISLLMTTPVQFVLGQPTDLTAKFVAIASVLKSETLVAGDVIDVAIPTEISVQGPG